MQKMRYPRMARIFYHRPSDTAITEGTARHEKTLFEKKCLFGKLLENSVNILVA